MSYTGTRVHNESTRQQAISPVRHDTATHACLYVYLGYDTTKRICTPQAPSVPCMPTVNPPTTHYICAQPDHCMPTSQYVRHVFLGAQGLSADCRYTRHSVRRMLCMPWKQSGVQLLSTRWAAAAAALRRSLVSASLMQPDPLRPQLQNGALSADDVPA